MAMYQETEKITAEKQGSDFLRQALALEARLKEEKLVLEQAESAFESADDAAFKAAASAAENEKNYQESCELLQTLQAEEESMQAATEMAAALATDASNIKTDQNTNYSDLLHQAMNALITVSANAEQELAEKKAQREKESKRHERLRVEKASSQVASYMAAVQRAKMDQNRLHAENQYTLTENQYKLAQTQSELTETLKQIKEGRAALDGILAAYYHAVQQAEALSAEEARHKAELEGLKKDLSAADREIIPYETLINDLEHEERGLFDACAKAKREAEAAAQEQVQAIAAFDAAVTAEKEYEQRSSQQINDLLAQNRTSLQAAEQQLQAAQAALANAADLAEQARLGLDTHLARIPVLENDCSVKREAIEKAKNTAGETARMVANVQAVKFSMKKKSSGVLSSAESVLHSTLQAANDMVQEKEEAYAEAKQNLEEAREASHFLQQAAEESEQVRMEMDEAFKNAQKEYQDLLEQSSRAESELQGEAEQKRGDAYLQRINAAEILSEAEKRSMSKKKTAQDLSQRLEALQIQYQDAIRSRDDMQKQLYEINVQLEEEKMRTRADREQQIIQCWEESENLQMRARELSLQLERDIEKTQKLNAQEQRLNGILLRVQREANQSMKDLHKQYSSQLSDCASLVTELKEALELYQKNEAFLPRSRRLEYSQALQSAKQLLENGEQAKLDFLSHPFQYDIEIGKTVSFDPSLILEPIPQINRNNAELQISLPSHSNTKPQTIAEPITIPATEELIQMPDISQFKEEKSPLSPVLAEEKAEEPLKVAEIAANEEPTQRALEEEEIVLQAEAPAELEEGFREEAPKVETPVQKDVPDLLAQLRALVGTEEIPSNQPEQTMAAQSPIYMEEKAPVQEVIFPQEEKPASNSIQNTFQAEGTAPKSSVEDFPEEKLQPSNQEMTAFPAEILEEAPKAAEETIAERLNLPEETVQELPAQPEPAVATATAADMVDTVGESIFTPPVEGMSGTTAPNEVTAPVSPALPDALDMEAGLATLFGGFDGREGDGLSLLLEDITILKKGISQTEAKQQQASMEMPSMAPPSENIASPTVDEPLQAPSYEDVVPENAASEKEDIGLAGMFQPMGAYQFDDPTDQLANEINSLRQMLYKTENVPAAAPVQAAAPQLDPNAPLIQESDLIEQQEPTAQATSMDALRSQWEQEAAQQEAERMKQQEEAAQQEYERLLREEEAAQREAERQASLKAQEDQKAAASEAERLTRLAEEAAQLFSQNQAQQKVTRPSPALTEAPSKVEDEDDIEAELRRLIFSNFE